MQDLVDQIKNEEVIVVAELTTSDKLKQMELAELSTLIMRLDSLGESIEVHSTYLVEYVDAVEERVREFGEVPPPQFYKSEINIQDKNLLAIFGECANILSEYSGVLNNIIAREGKSTDFDFTEEHAQEILYLSVTMERWYYWHLIIKTFHDNLKVDLRNIIPAELIEGYYAFDGKLDDEYESLKANVELVKIKLSEAVHYVATTSAVELSNEIAELVAITSSASSGDDSLEVNLQDPAPDQ